MNIEGQRIELTPEGNDICNPSIKIFAKSTNAEVSLTRVKEVMHLIASACDGSRWPSDTEWSKVLPNWFLEPFQGRTIEQVLEDDSLWDFGSWLDAMHQRGWQWWTSSCGKDDWTITLLRLEDVYSIEPFIYLCRQSGAFSVNIVEDMNESTRRIYE